MSRKLFLSGIVLLTAMVMSFPLSAQSPRGYGQQGTAPHVGRGPGQGQGPGLCRGSCPEICQGHLDPTSKVSLEGAVDSLRMEPGQGAPYFTMTVDGKKLTIITSPLWALLDAEYKIALGDKMRVLAFASPQLEGAYIAAELLNLTNGTALTLRDANGFPLGNRGGRGAACTCPAHSSTAPNN